MKLIVKNLVFSIAVVTLAACAKKDVEQVITPASVTDVYIAGNVLTANNKNIAAYWKNGTLFKLVNDSTVNSYAYNVAVSGNDVYVSGVIYNSSLTTREVVYWKNGIINKLTGIDGSSGSIPAIEVNGNDVYVTGAVSILQLQSTRQAAAYWKNGIPQTLKLSPIDNVVEITSLVVNGNDVYLSGTVIGGRFDATYWKNGEQTKLNTSNLMSGSLSWGMALQGNDIYIAGLNGSDPGYWKNGIFNNLLTDYNTLNSIAVKGSDVYIAGSKFESLSSPNLKTVSVYWKNRAIENQIGNSAPYGNNFTAASATGLVLNGDDVYVIGSFNTSSPSYWKNNTLIPFSTNTKATGYGICVVNK